MTTKTASTAQRIVYNCTGKIKTVWQKRLVERIEAAITEAARTGRHPDEKNDEKRDWVIPVY